MSLTQDDFYGTSDEPTLDYPDSDGPVIDLFTSARAFSRQRVAVHADGGVLTISPDGTLWYMNPATGVPGTQCTFPDIISALNASFSDPDSVYAVENHNIVAGVACNGAKWYILVHGCQNLAIIGDASTYYSFFGGITVIDARYKVYTSTAASPTDLSDWTLYRTIFAGYTGTGIMGVSPTIQYYFTAGVRTSVGWSLSFGTPAHFPVRFSDGTIRLIGDAFTSVSDTASHEVYLNLDGSISQDSGDALIFTYEVGPSDFFGTSRQRYFDPSTLALLGVWVSESGGVLTLNAPQTVPDYSTGVTPSRGGAYIGGTPCGASGHVAAIVTDDIAPITLAPGADDPLGGWEVVIGMGFSGGQRKVQVFDTSGGSAYSETDYAGASYELLFGSFCEQWNLTLGYGPVPGGVDNVFDVSFRSSDVQVNCWGVGVGGTVLRSRFFYDASLSQTKFGLYVDSGESDTVEIYQQVTGTEDVIRAFTYRPPGVGTTFLAGYAPISFDGDGTAPILIGGFWGNIILPTGEYSDYQYSLDNSLGILSDLQVLGCCDDGGAGAYAILSDNGLYHIIADPDNVPWVKIDGDVIATDVTVDGDSVQFMRRRSNNDIIGCHGQFGANQSFIVRGSTVIKGTPFSFSSRTYNTQISLGSAGTEQTSGFSSAIAL